MPAKRTLPRAPCNHSSHHHASYPCPLSGEQPFSGQLSVCICPFFLLLCLVLFFVCLSCLSLSVFASVSASLRLSPFVFVRLCLFYVCSTVVGVPRSDSNCHPCVCPCVSGLVSACLCLRACLVCLFLCPCACPYAYLPQQPDLAAFPHDFVPARFPLHLSPETSDPSAAPTSAHRANLNQPPKVSAAKENSAPILHHAKTN